MKYVDNERFWRSGSFFGVSLSVKLHSVGVRGNRPVSYEVGFVLLKSKFGILGSCGRPRSYHNGFIMTIFNSRSNYNAVASEMSCPMPANLPRYGVVSSAYNKYTCMAICPHPLRAPLPRCATRRPRFVSKGEAKNSHVALGLERPTAHLL